MENTFGSRVREYRTFKQLSQQAFAAQCGLEQGNITQMEKGTEPKQSNITKLITGFPDLNPDWLLMGAGTMLRDGRVLVPIAPEPAADYSSAGSTEQTLYISVLKEQVLDLKSQVADLKEDKADLRAEVQELRGKPSDSSDAADALGQPAPTAPMPRLRVQRVHGLRRYQ